MEQLELSSKELLSILEKSSIEYDGYKACDIVYLEQITKFTLSDRYNVYVRVSDGILVIPYSYNYSAQNSVFDIILSLSVSFMAHDEPHTISKIIENHKEIISLLESK